MTDPVAWVLFALLVAVGLYAWLATLVFLKRADRPHKCPRCGMLSSADGSNPVLRWAMNRPAVASHQLGMH